MKIAHIADVHLDRPFAGLGDVEGERARRRLMDGFRRALATAVEHRVDAITIGGDLWEHENVRVDTRRAVASAFAEVGMPVGIICGNHDPYVPGGPHARTEWPANVHVFDSDQPSRWVPREGGAAIWGLSWEGGSLRADFLRGFDAGPGPSALLIHGTANRLGQLGAEAAHCPFDPADLSAAGFDVCLAGHIHAGRWDPPVVYPGSPEPLGWGEDGIHSVAIVELESGGTRVELVEVNSHRYETRVVECVGAGSSAEVEARLREAIGAGDRSLHLQVDIVGEVEPDCEIDEEALAERLGDGLAELRVRDQTDTGYDIERVASRATVDGIFVGLMREGIEAAAAEGDEERAVMLKEAMLVGLRALDGRGRLIGSGVGDVD